MTRSITPHIIAPALFADVLGSTYDSSIALGNTHGPGSSRFGNTLGSVGVFGRTFGRCGRGWWSWGWCTWCVLGVAGREKGSQTKRMMLEPSCRRCRQLIGRKSVPLDRLPLGQFVGWRARGGGGRARGDGVLGGRRRER